jgi:hypothetical protein
MDESVITSTTLTTDPYAELHTTNARIITMSSATKAFPYSNSFNDDEELDTKAEIELEDKAQGNGVDNEDVENEDSESSDDEAEDASQSIVKSAFVDLINMVSDLF